MIRSFFHTLFAVTIIATPFFMPSYGTANCDFEKTPISLKAVNKPVTEILKDIAKQTKYTIEVQSVNALDNKKSIELDQAPLDLTLNRLLKGHNYSIICNNNQKILTLVFLDKGSPSSRVSSRISAAPPQTNSMEGLAAAFDEYRNNSIPPSSPQEEPKEMKGISSAMQSYKSKTEKQTLTPMPHTQKTSMDAATTALDEYKSNNQDSGYMSYPKNNNSPEMDNLAAAMDEYRNMNTSSEHSDPQSGEPTSMDGATTAMDEYNNQHNN